MAKTKEETIRNVTNDYLDTIDPDNPPTPAVIQGELLEQVHDAYEIVNNMKPKGEKWRYLDRLVPRQIADSLLHLYPIANIACAGTNAETDYDILGIYQSNGENEGIYVNSENAFYKLAQEYCYSITTKEVKEVIHIIRENAPRKTRCDDPNLIAVNNGIFDYETKTLMPFDPDFVFIAKSKVNYNDQAYNVTIHNPDDNTDWDVESWMDDLSDDPEIVNLLWQILGAIIRPNVPWNKSGWLYSCSGNSGKGCLCELMRQLSGEGSYASIPLSNFGKDFMLEPLIRATSIIVDENDVGTYIDKAANLKAIITNDVIQMNRKFKTPIAYQFKGFMVQCLNEMPRIKDKSDSFYRRQLFIPFTKCFTGKERKYIKKDYLHRPEVLEYVLYKVLNMDYYTLSEPQACKDVLEEYKEFNDPVREFFSEFVMEAEWDLLPFDMLYEAYTKWFKDNNPSGIIQGKSSFKKEIATIADNSIEWKCPNRNSNVRTCDKMSVYEPLVIKYDLTDWQNNKQSPADTDEERGTPQPGQFKDQYRGLARRKPKHSKVPIIIKKG